MAWQDNLQQASWNDVPFGVDLSDDEYGRLTGEHVYPFREKDQAWVEDTGLAPNSHRIVGYLIGDDVTQQQLDMIAAVQIKGQGNLVHPLLGFIIGSIVGGCRFTWRADAGGNYLELVFRFVENVDTAPYPTQTGGTQQAVTTQAATAQTTIAGSFQAAVSNIRASAAGFIGSTGLPGVVSDVAAFGRQVQGVVGDAAQAFNGARSVLASAENLGRYVTPAAIPGISTASAAVAYINQGRATVSNAVGAMNQLARVL